MTIKNWWDVRNARAMERLDEDPEIKEALVKITVCLWGISAYGINLVIENRRNWSSNQTRVLMTLYGISLPPILDITQTLIRHQIRQMKKR